MRKGIAVIISIWFMLFSPLSTAMNTTSLVSAEERKELTSLAFVADAYASLIYLCLFSNHNGELIRCRALIHDKSSPYRIKLSQDKRHVYYTNHEGGIIHCNIDDGWVVCEPPVMIGRGDILPAIAINDVRHQLYTANSIGDVYTCDLKTNGDVDATDCTVWEGTSGGVNGMVYHAASDKLYFSSITNALFSCRVKGDKPTLVNQCVTDESSRDAFNMPVSMVINQAGTRIYVANLVGFITQCELNRLTGEINDNSCVMSSSPLFTQPNSIALNNDESRIYLTNDLGKDIVSCALDEQGAIGDCASSPSNLLEPLGIVFY